MAQGKQRPGHVRGRYPRTDQETPCARVHEGVAIRDLIECQKRPNGRIKETY